MKTIEQKAKAYDEALEDMRVIYPNLKGEVKLAVEHAFPQLRESEDERMRKRAIAILKQQRDYWSYDGPMAEVPPATPRKDLVNAIDVALSYLEKQEQKPSWTEDDDDWVSNFERLLEFAYEHDPHGLGKICIAGKVWLNDRLKAFRPSLKLSEGQDTEYIRKDTLLEWAKEVINDTSHSLAYRGAFRDLINKINPL